MSTYYWADHTLNCATLLTPPGRHLLLSTRPCPGTPTRFYTLDEAMDWHAAHSDDGQYLERVGENQWTYKGGRVYRTSR